MKPFLMLQLRPDDYDASGELAAVMKYGNLKDEDILAVRMEKEGVKNINLDDYSGVIMGGGPSNVSDAHEQKTEEQKRFEADLVPILNEIIEKDIPFMGICYGLNILATYLNGEVSKEKFTENVGGVDLMLTDESKGDPLTKGLPTQFRTFVGHKEACQDLPKDCVLLASSKTCPVQMIRHKKNIYACQFHPELDVEGIIVRINIHKFNGYFPPEEANPLIEEVKKEKIVHPHAIMERFIKLYAK